VYYDSQTQVVFDPRSTLGLISGIEDDEMKFINFKIGGTNHGIALDFEFEVENTDSYTDYHRNYITGKVGELPVGRNYDVSMLWETGNALVSNTEATTCTYDNSTCF
jgi:hypothetical protein